MDNDDLIVQLGALKDKLTPSMLDAIHAVENTSFDCGQHDSDADHDADADDDTYQKVYRRALQAEIELVTAILRLAQP